MKHDMIVDSEAMAAIEGNDVTHLLGTPLVLDMQEEPQRAAFNAYRVAFRANEAHPSLNAAIALVDAWNGLADVVGLDRV